MVTENNNKTGFIGAINSQWLKICEAIIWKEYFSGLICCLFYTQTNIIWYSINKNSPCILQLQVSIFERRRATSFTIAAASSPDWSWGPKTSSIRGWPARFRSTRTLQNVLESLITNEHDTLFINSYLWNWSMTWLKLLTFHRVLRNCVTLVTPIFKTITVTMDRVKCICIFLYQTNAAQKAPIIWKNYQCLKKHFFAFSYIAGLFTVGCVVGYKHQNSYKQIYVYLIVMFFIIT